MASNMCDEGEEKLLSFHELGLDDRILEAISKLKWKDPTLIQERAIPLALEGKDILARARTGSGKTAAFAIPIIQHILQRKELSKMQVTKALVMAPTRELCNQLTTTFRALTTSCSREIRCVDISPQLDLPAQRPLLVDKPDVVIGTPSRVLAHLDAGNMILNESLELLAIDEADLVLAYGSENDIKAVLEQLPEIYQAFLMSATMSQNLNSLKHLILHNPAILKLEEPMLPSSNQLEHYHIKCEEEDKFAIIYAMLKLRLLRGKCLVFMKTVDRCYKMRLYLEQFGITSCVLNSELPIATRCHIVSQFNEGLYDIIIASDDKIVVQPETAIKNPQKKKRKVDHEYGVSRGIDFQFVANVINFDFPEDVTSYVHRVGRTARGKHKGIALSLVSVKELPMMAEVEKVLVENQGGSEEKVFKRYQLKIEKMQGFLYRSRDALRAVTRIAIREARLKEIKQEIINSKKLKTYFEDNPRDLQVLRHDSNLHTVKIQSHLKNVPDYIVPDGLKHLTKTQLKIPGVKNQWNNSTKRKPKNHVTKSERKFRKRKNDPLSYFQARGHGKKKGS